MQNVDAKLAAALVPRQPGAAPPELILRGATYSPSVRITITPVNGRNIALLENVAHHEQAAFLVTAALLGPPPKVI